MIRLFLVVLTIVPMLGFLSTIVLRRFRHSPSNAVKSQPQVTEIVAGTEVVGPETEPAFTEKTVESSLNETVESNDSQDLPKARPQVSDMNSLHLETDRRIRFQLMELRQAEEEQRRRIDAATRRRDGPDPKALTENKVRGELADHRTITTQLSVISPDTRTMSETANKESMVAVLEYPDEETIELQEPAAIKPTEPRKEDEFRFITEAFDNLEPETRNAAALALYDFQSDPTASFTRALRESSPERRRRIGAAVASSGLAEKAINDLTREDSEDFDAFSLLFLMVKAGEIEPLIRAIEESQNNDVRIAIIKLMSLTGQHEIVPAFRRLAVRVSLPIEVRSAVMEAIDQLSSHKSQVPTGMS